MAIPPSVPPTDTGGGAAVLTLPETDFSVPPYLLSAAPAAIAGLTGLIQHEDLPSCIYFLCMDAEVVYVGQSYSLALRIGSHRRKKRFDSIFYLPCPLEKLNETESAFISELDPPLNKAGVASYSLPRRSKRKTCKQDHRLIVPDLTRFQRVLLGAYVKRNERIDESKMEKATCLMSAQLADLGLVRRIQCRKQTYWELTGDGRRVACALAKGREED